MFLLILDVGDSVTYVLESYTQTHTHTHTRDFNFAICLILLIIYVDLWMLNMKLQFTDGFQDHLHSKNWDINLNY